MNSNFYGNFPDHSSFLSDRMSFKGLAISFSLSQISFSFTSMQNLSLLTILSLLAIVVSAGPHMVKSYPRASSAQNVVYWGQNGGDTIENHDLSKYCTSSAGIDIIVLSFLYDYGNGNTIPSGTIGQSCSISASGEPSQCDGLADAIKTCQSNGVKIILSLGGAVGTYSLSSQEEAETIGQNLWDAYGRTPNNCVPRPFGTTFVNGWDFDIEAARGNQYYQYLIRTLRSNFVSDSSNTYFIHHNALYQSLICSS